MENVAEYNCACCGEVNSTWVDLSQGSTQSYIEDCQVCCRPNTLYVTIDEETLAVEITTDFLE